MKIKSRGSEVTPVERLKDLAPGTPFVFRKDLDDYSKDECLFIRGEENYVIDPEDGAFYTRDEEAFVVPINAHIVIE